MVEDKELWGGFPSMCWDEFAKYVTRNSAISPSEAKSLHDSAVIKLKSLCPGWRTPQGPNCLCPHTWMHNRERNSPVVLPHPSGLASPSENTLAFASPGSHLENLYSSFKTKLKYLLISKGPTPPVSGTQLSSLSLCSCGPWLRCMGLWATVGQGLG